MYLKLKALGPDRGIPSQRRELLKDFWAPDGTHRRVTGDGLVSGSFDEVTAADLLATGDFVEDPDPRPVEAVLAQAEAVGNFLAQLREAARIVFRAVLQHDERARGEATAVVSEVRTEVEDELGPPPSELPADDDSSGEEELVLAPPAEQNPAAPATAGDPRQGDPAAGDEPAAGEPPTDPEPAPAPVEDPNVLLARGFEMLQKPEREIRDEASAVGLVFKRGTDKVEMVTKILGLPAGWNAR